MASEDSQKLDAIYEGVKAILANLDIKAADRTQERVEAEKKAREFYQPGGGGYLNTYYGGRDPNSDEVTEADKNLALGALLQTSGGQAAWLQLQNENQPERGAMPKLDTPQPPPPRNADLAALGAEEDGEPVDAEEAVAEAAKDAAKAANKKEK